MNSELKKVCSQAAKALEEVRKHLLNERDAEGHWRGDAGASAVATATATTALALAARHSRRLPETMVRRSCSGLEWISRNANPDGGWGDTLNTASNLTATLLCWSAFFAIPGGNTAFASAVRAGEAWLRRRVGGLEPERIACAMLESEGKAEGVGPLVLGQCALTDRFGRGAEAWKWAESLQSRSGPSISSAGMRSGEPLAWMTRPARLAAGICRERFSGPGNGRQGSSRRNGERDGVDVIARFQSGGGSFLGSVVLTSFVVMFLGVAGWRSHPVVEKGIRFLVDAARPGGGWTLGDRLGTRLTVLATNALLEDREYRFDAETAENLCRWLLGQQGRSQDAYTGGPPGGWSSDGTPGGPSNADETGGVLLVLRQLSSNGPEVKAAAERGVQWLLGAQTREGSLPAYYPGSGAQGSRASTAGCPVLTAQAIRAWAAWREGAPETLSRRIDSATKRAARFLRLTTPDEVRRWRVVRIGNPAAPDRSNWTYGVSRTLGAWEQPGWASEPRMSGSPAIGLGWLLRAQAARGGWSGFIGGRPSVEETALALEALAGSACLRAAIATPALFSGWSDAVHRGMGWLLHELYEGGWGEATPIERSPGGFIYPVGLYPWIFGAGALGRVKSISQALPGERVAI